MWQLLVEKFISTIKMTVRPWFRVLKTKDRISEIVTLVTSRELIIKFIYDRDLCFDFVQMKTKMNSSTERLD